MDGHEGMIPYLPIKLMGLVSFFLFPSFFLIDTFLQPRSRVFMAR
jgi:hypothetical protein